MAVYPIQVISPLLKERLAPALTEVLSHVDPVTRNMQLNTKAVTQLGRDDTTPAAGSAGTFVAKHRIRMGRSGVQYFHGLNHATGGVGSIPMLPETTVFPSAGKATQPTFLTQMIYLKWLMGNCALDINQLKGMTLGPTLGDIATMVVTDQAFNVAQDMATLMHVGKSAKLGTIYDPGSNIVFNDLTPNNDYTNTITLTDAPPGRFRRGQRVSISATATYSQLSGGVFIIQSVNPKSTNGTVDLVLTEDGTTTVTLSTATEYGLYMADPSGSNSNACSGLPDWIVNTGTVFNLDLTNNPELRAWVDNGGGTNKRPASNLMFERLLTEMWTAGRQLPTVIVTSMGVCHARAEALKGMQMWSPSAGLGVLSAGGGKSTGDNVTFGETVIPIKPSRIATPERAWGIHEPTNVRYTPDGLEGVEWINDLTGSGGGPSGVFSPVSYQAGSSAGATQRSSLMEAPFSVYAEFASEAPFNNAVWTLLEEVSDQYSVS